MVSEETWEEDNHESYRYVFRIASNFVMLLEWADENKNKKVKIANIV